MGWEHILSMVVIIIKVKLLLLISVVIILVGCNSFEEDKALIISSDIIKSVKTVPNNFYNESDERVKVKKVTNQADFNNTWSQFELKGIPNEIDWNSKASIFLAITESGSCPFRFKAVELYANKKDMIIHLDEQSKSGACTADITPRTMIIEVDKDDVSGIVNVEIFGVETHYGKTPKVKLISE
ncbi:MAG: hypothetical protein LRY73_09590 [Bacillus sp. (in: Bacteria)]|nr:hypothetical protein [Bacillus sp. (in: firmicutes)]